MSETHSGKRIPGVFDSVPHLPMRTLLLFCSTLLPFVTAAAEPRPLLTVPGQLLLADDFAGPAVPGRWQPGGRANAFTIVDGAMQGVCLADDSHGPSIGVPIEARDLTIQFAFKYAQPGNFLFLVDGESEFGGAAHLLRVGLSDRLLVLQQDRGTLASKQAQKREKDAAAKSGAKQPTPTKDQLADPKFYRTERLAAQPRKIADGQWHRVLVEISGNEVVAQVDDGPPLTATGTVIGAKKSRLVFLVGGAGTVLIDDVKVWESTRFPAR